MTRGSLILFWNILSQNSSHVIFQLYGLVYIPVYIYNNNSIILLQNYVNQRIKSSAWRYYTFIMHYTFIQNRKINLLFCKIVAIFSVIRAFIQGLQITVCLW